MGGGLGLWGAGREGQEREREREKKKRRVKEKFFAASFSSNDLLM